MVGSDAELVRSAQSGDATGLGMLLARHLAGMRAVALSVLGYGPDADDAVQDAAILAIRRIGDLRDPDAAGAWLRTIVRNVCRMRLRQPEPVLRPGPAFDRPSSEFTPEELLERQVLRDWVWHALGELTEPLRVAVLLRYFSSASSYDQIAAICAVPIGTVRSRLSQARARLADALLATAGAAHDDVAALTGARHREAAEIIAASERGEFAAVVAQVYAPEAEIVGPQGQRGGLDTLVRIMDTDLNAGVRQRIAGVVAGRDVTIWEADLISPPDDPGHCPPSVVWLQVLRSGRVHRLRLYHPTGRTSHRARASGR
jgi:RNA polymerase sigma factor (sigma-70 family)